MTSRQDLSGRQGRRSFALAVFLVVQSVAAISFLADVTLDLVQDGLSANLLIEAVVGAALALGLAYGIVETRRALDLMRAQATALDAASGALARVVTDQFATWSLTPAETDVAFLALKGLDVAEIATARGAAQGTVRAQLARVYAKAGVSGRAQFAAYFVEDLLADGVPQAVTPQVDAAARRA